MRTQDTNYGADYWNTLDGGNGYKDSILWTNLSFIVKELFGIDPERGDISPEVNICDIGCAFGFSVRWLRRQGFDAWGLDFSEYAIGRAPMDIRTYLRLYDLTSTDPCFYGDEQFKAVTCFETLEHIEEPAIPQALNNIYRVLVPGGRALLTICTEDQPGWDSDPTHVTIKSRDWWIPRLESAGFDLEERSVEWLRQFWLFRHHHGVFVLTKPAG